tara:strand:+ start:343 stop:720 length:378 start_codon:yes stop_codon:yes gene_type:complete
MINERKRQQFWDMQNSIQKKFKGAHTKINSDGGVFVADARGRNIIGTKYPDLAIAKDVFTAWKNTFLIEHWNRQEARSIRGIQCDIKNNTVQGGEDMSKAIYEYFEDAPEIYDEEEVTEEDYLSE